MYWFDCEFICSLFSSVKMDKCKNDIRPFLAKPPAKRHRVDSDPSASSQQETSVSKASETELNEHENGTELNMRENGTVTYTQEDLEEFVEISFQALLKEARTKRDELLRLIRTRKLKKCTNCKKECTPKSIQEKSKKANEKANELSVKNSMKPLSQNSLSPTRHYQNI